MHVVGVQIGTPKKLQTASRLLTTGIDKQPVEGADVGPYGLVGDAICDTEHHGGLAAAVYAYSRTDYEWWEAQLGRELAPGSFGENLTLSAFGADPPRVGDRYHIGSVVLEVTAPRIPCGTFSAHMGEADWIRRFRDARRPGFYARVIDSGHVSERDEVEFEAAAADRATILDLQDEYYSGS